MKKSIIRKIIALGVILAMALAFAGCGKGQSAKDAPYSLSIEDAFVCTDYEGKVLVLNLSVTNNSEYSVESMNVGFDVSVALDGKYLDPSYLANNNANYLPDETIAPGETGTAQAVFALGDTTEGELVITGLAYPEDYAAEYEVLNETLDLASLEWIETKSDFEVTLDKVIAADNGYGEDVVILDMTFTNNSSEATCFSYSVDLKLFQNGIGLSRSYLSDDCVYYDEDLEDSRDTDIQSGYSLSVRMVYELNDTTTPIELSAIDYTIYSEEVELYSCVIQLDPSSPASGDNVIIAEAGTGSIAVNVGTADDPNSNGGSSSGGSGLTLEEYFEQHPEDYESFTSTMTSGMTCEVIGNDVTVTYAYDDVFDDAVIELMQPTFEAAMSSMDSTFESTIGLIETSFGVSGVTLKVVYVDAAGTELYSKTY